MSILSILLSLAVNANGPAASEIAVGVTDSCNVGTSLSTNITYADAGLCLAAVTVKETVSSAFGMSSSNALTITSTSLLPASIFMSDGISNRFAISHVIDTNMSESDARSADMRNLIVPPSFTS